MGALRTAVITTIALVVLTVLVVIEWSPLVALDERIAAGGHDFGVVRPGWVGVQLVITTALSPWPWRVLVSLLAVREYLRQRKRAAVLMITALVAGGVLGSLLKLAVGRARPTNPFESVGGWAFPSGHAVTAVIGPALLAMAAPPRLRLPALLAAAAVAGLVGWTRIGLNVHWASDVVGGWLLGVAVVALTRLWAAAPR